MTTSLHVAPAAALMSAASAALYQELVDTREALRSGAQLERAPREQRQRRVLASRVFLLALQLHWRGCSAPSASGILPLHHGRCSGSADPQMLLQA